MDGVAGLTVFGCTIAFCLLMKSMHSTSKERDQTDGGNMKLLLAALIAITAPDQIEQSQPPIISYGDSPAKANGWTDFLAANDRQKYKLMGDA